MFNLALSVLPTVVLPLPQILGLTVGNSGNALTDFFLQEVGITQFEFNIGQQLLSAGIVLLEASRGSCPYFG